MRRFVIVGSGWRAMYYARIAKALPKRFELCAMLCRNASKAEKISEEYGIHTTLSVEECELYKPDFVVVAVNKTSMFEVTKEWLMKGFTVLCETPAALDLNELNELWRLHNEGLRQCVAEQYLQYPEYNACKRIVESRILGDINNATVSLAHDYHGASLIRGMLGVGNEKFRLYGNSYSFPIVETADRYERYTDGRMMIKKRDRVTFEFESGKVAFYDFDSVQYRSLIRDNYINIQGTRGELKDHQVLYLDEKNIPCHQEVQINLRKTTRNETNPNLMVAEEVTDIKFLDELLYEPPFGLCGLTQDETAIAVMMESAAQYNSGKEYIYPLKEALTDSYMSILMQKALSNPRMVIESEIQEWMK